jgi:hypothetical protein
MRRQLAATAVLSGTLVTGSLLGTGAAFAAPSTCDAYSTSCPTPTKTPEVLPTSATKPPVEVEGNSSTLPFTGAEIVGLSVLGLAVIGAGTVLVLAGRKRKHAA